MPRPKVRRHLDSVEIPSSLYVAPPSVDTAIYDYLQQDKDLSRFYDKLGSLLGTRVYNAPYVQLRRPVVVSRKRNSQLIKDAQKAFPDKKDREDMYRDLEYLYGNVRSKDSNGNLLGGPETSLKNLLGLWHLAGKPSVDNVGGSVGVNGFGGTFLGENFRHRANYVPDTNTIYQTNPNRYSNAKLGSFESDYMDELSHAMHANYPWMDKHGLRQYGSYADMLENFVSHGASDKEYITPTGVKTNNYNNPDSFEYMAHKVIEEAMKKAMLYGPSQFDTFLGNTIAKKYPKGVPGQFRTRPTQLELRRHVLGKARRKLGFSNGGSIHINPANRGKFTATMKRTGKTAEELSHSSNPLTRKRAIFALNARKWNH